MMEMAQNMFSDLLENNKNNTDCGFSSFGVNATMCRLLRKDKILSPTEIQKKVLPIALRGVDIFACAKTGSGKTLSYIIPLIIRMMNKPKVTRTTRALIIVPTRELAFQVFEVLQNYSFGKLTSALIIGGENNRVQESKIRSGSDIIVCTPGRIIDHIYNCPTFSLKQIEFLILDEADRLLDENFYEQLEEIVKHSPRTRQTMLFSATLNDRVKTMGCLALKNPVKLFADESSTLVGTLSQKYIRLRSEQLIKKEAFVTMICELYREDFILIFCETKKQAHRLYTILKILKISALELHGNMKQTERNNAIDEFRMKKCRVLVSTSLSSRGLDISQITLVVNFDIPKSLEEYVHRVGRTARAGRDGTSITLFSSPQRKYWKQIRSKEKGSLMKFEYDQNLYQTHLNKLESISSQIIECLKNDKFCYELEQTQRELTSAENRIKHSNEIMSRPARKFMKMKISKSKQLVPNQPNAKRPIPLKKSFASVKKFKRLNMPKKKKMTN